MTFMLIINRLQFLIYGAAVPAVLVILLPWYCSLVLAPDTCLSPFHTALTFSLSHHLEFRLIAHVGLCVVHSSNSLH